MAVGMIFLRELQEKDAILMLEWMHDAEIQRGFKKNLSDMTLADARAFCQSAKLPIHPEEGQSLHFAVADEKDEYMGTISLKEVSIDSRSAEYAISLRRAAQGRGIARTATGLLLQKAFREYGLHRVYLNVLADNERAIHLYERCGFQLEGEFREHLLIGGRYMNWKWYGMLETEYDENMFGGGYRRFRLCACLERLVA